MQVLVMFNDTSLSSIYVYYPLSSELLHDLIPTWLATADVLIMKTKN